MFIIIVFDRVLKRSSPVSSQDFYCSLPMERKLIKSILHFEFLHLLSGYYYYDWSNRCAEALVAYRILFSIGLLLSKKVKRLKIIIIAIVPLLLVLNST